MAFETRITNTLNKKIWIIPVLFGLMCFFLVSSIVGLEIRSFTTAGTVNALNAKFSFSIGGEIVAMLVAIMITISILPTYKRQNGYIRIFVTLLTVGCSVLYLDTIQMIVDGLEGFGLFNKIVSILVFASETWFFFFFWMYITYVLKTKGKIMNVLYIIVSALLVVFWILPLVNFFYPLYFTMNADVYVRNPDTWWICRIYIFVIVISVIIALIISKEKIKTKIVIIAFMGIPLVALGAGGFQYGVSVLYSSMMVSLVLIYALLFSENEKHLYSTSKELGIATSIQKHMLPNTFPAFPDRKEFDIYALMDPAKEVGGDFYDFFLIDETHLGMVMADVSDKGVPAALFMMASKIMVQNYAKLGGSPKEVLTAVNKQICANKQDDMFVTVWLGVLDLTTGILKASNGGHEKPAFKYPGEDFKIYKDKAGFVVGWDADSIFQEYELELPRGTKIYLYTDGVPETNNAKGERYTREKMLESLNKYGDLSPEGIIKGVKSDLEAYADHTDQFDDTTMLCIEFKGYDEGPKDNTVTLLADVNKLDDAINPILKALEEAGADSKIIYKIHLCLEEVIANVALYAYPKDVKGYMKVGYSFEENPKAIIITIKDKGKPFNPLEEVPEPDLDASVEDRKIGGLGIFITKKTMDEISYNRIDDENVLMMKKEI